jgi:hypothetical protein
MRKIFSLTIVLVMVLSVAVLSATTAYAAEAGYEVIYSGTSSAPVFTLNGRNVYCVEPEANHPETGMIYNPVGGQNNVFDNIFINAYEYTGEKNTTFYQTVQLAIWSVVNPSVNYRGFCGVMLGTTNVYDYLLQDCDKELYVVSYTTYGTEVTDELGNGYQKLLGATVQKVAPIIEPEEETEPDTTVPDTTVPDVEETTESPTEPDTTEPDTTEPDTTVPDTTVQDMEETTEPTTEPELIPVDGGVDEFPPAPKTGDNAPVVLAAVALSGSVAGLIYKTKIKKD